MPLPKSKYTPKQLEALQKDSVIRKRVKEDEELLRLFNPSADDDELKATHQALGGCLSICGQQVPPPTLGSIRILSLINSPFVSPKPVWQEPYFAIIEAMYCLINGSDALTKDSGAFLWHDRIKYYKEQAKDISNPVWFEKLLEAEKKECDYKAAWILRVSKWANDNNVKIELGETLSSTINQLMQYINTAFTGLTMFPACDSVEKKPGEKDEKDIKVHTCDNEWEANIFRWVNETVSIEEQVATWKTPFIKLCHYAAAGAEKAGLKGMGRRPNGGPAMERLEGLMDERLRELGLL